MTTHPPVPVPAGPGAEAAGPAEGKTANYWHKRWLAAMERADEDGMQAISQHVRIQELTARAEAAEAKLARIRAEASEWATLAPADEWAESLVDTFKADVGRVLLAITGTGKEEARDGG